MIDILSESDDDDLLGIADEKSQDFGYQVQPNKYQRLREVRNVLGYIVNVHDATNYDIDLALDPELRFKYERVISNRYVYEDFDEDLFYNPGALRSRLPQSSKTGVTYRCRLRGVGINHLSTHQHLTKSNQMCVEVKQLLDRSDGWVICNLSDIDVYQRLLVDVTILGTINLREYLLNKMIGEPMPIFYPYVGKKDRMVAY